MAWLPLASTTVEPARLAIARWASGGILLSSVATRYQLGLVLHAGSLIAPLRHATPHGTWESAQNAAFSGPHTEKNDREANEGCYQNHEFSNFENQIFTKNPRIKK